MDENETHLSATEARGGQKTNTVRYVLGISLFAIVHDLRHRADSSIGKSDKTMTSPLVLESSGRLSSRSDR